ncbi:unnamed protein product [Ranitomeya imitator]|uniref:GAS2-like protein 1 n=1 Tax=Ranitomeya imitator TaxID=111125 RepID=A0ABN9KRH2_9NEOB|nr:unnamed protein product [Ranitomeya imitator]
MADQSQIQSSASKSIRPFRSSEEYLEAMKEDLTDWLNMLYDLDMEAATFLEALETGYTLCQHANNLNRLARDFKTQYPDAAATMRLPQKEVTFQVKGALPSSFLARDNVSNFIGWCRKELGIPEVLMFETNDLVLRKGEKSFVLCLLEVARRGARFGMPAPTLIQMEEEIEEELSRGRPNADQKGYPRPQMPARPPRTLCDLKNLDELVREILGCCQCPSQFPMIKVSEGKYQVGDSNTLIFVRVLRSHVMVRVGGGWDTLEHYLDKHDPCRCQFACLLAHGGILVTVTLLHPLFRAPLVRQIGYAPAPLDVRQEQQLYRSLEKEFLENSRLLGSSEHPGGTQGASLLLSPPSSEPAALDSAYCSSSSSSSSLNFYISGGPREQNTDGNIATLPASTWRRLPALSSSSDDSSCPPAAEDLQEEAEQEEASVIPEGDAGSSGVVLRPKKTLKRPDRIPSIYKLKLRPKIRPRADNQPDKSPSRIPTPMTYRTSSSPPKSAPTRRSWRSLQAVFFSDSGVQADNPCG